MVPREKLVAFLRAKVTSPFPRWILTVKSEILVLLHAIVLPGRNLVRWRRGSTIKDKGVLCSTQHALNLRGLEDISCNFCRNFPVKWKSINCQVNGVLI